MARNPRQRCALAAALIPLVSGGAWAGECSPFSYGRWVQVDPGSGANVEFLATHPEDPNVVICNSDACGMALTCDGGESWSIVNRGLVGGYVTPGGAVEYASGRPNCAVAWDPIDANYVYAVRRARVVRGRLQRGSPGTISWEIRGTIPVHGYVLDIKMDPDPDPDGVGEARIFYLIDRFGRIAFTRDGGWETYELARIPFSDEASKDQGGVVNREKVFGGTHNPLLAVHPDSPRAQRLLAVPCPTGTWYAWAPHNQEDPCAPANAPDPNVFWTWPDPNTPYAASLGLDPNATANGLVLLGPEEGVYRLVLACDNSVETTGSVYTKTHALAPNVPWVMRSEMFYDDVRYSPACLTIHPSDPNTCYLVSPRGTEGGLNMGIYRGSNLWAGDPAGTSWDMPIDPDDPNRVTVGYYIYPYARDAWGMDISRSDPNRLFFSADKLGVARSDDGGDTWRVVDTVNADPNGGRWTNRGLTAVHTQAVVVAPSDPDVYYIGRNDSLGSFKTEDGGRTFWRFFNLVGYQPNASPAYLTYSAGGTTYTKETSWFYAERNDPNWWVRGGIEANIVSGVVHPVDPNLAWFATYDAPTRHCSLVVRTTDGGQSLTIVLPDDVVVEDPMDPNFPPVRKHYVAMAADANCDTLFLAAADEGVFRSVDAGVSWSVSLDASDPNFVEDPTHGRFVTVDVCDADPCFVYCASGRDRFVSGRGHVYRSTDGGRTWTQTQPLDANYPAHSLAKVIVHPSDPNIVYAGVHDFPDNDVPVPDDAGVWRTVDGGASWTKLGPGGPDHWTTYCTALALDPKDPRNVYCAVSEQRTDASHVAAPGLYVKRGDADWERLADPACDDPGDPNFPLSNLITRYYSLDFHPKSGHLYVGTPAGAFCLPRQYVLSAHVYPDEDPNDPNIVTGKDYGNVYVIGERLDATRPDFTFSYATEVTLEAAPRLFHEFSGWVGHLPAGLDANDPLITVVIDRDRQIWAVFDARAACGTDLGTLTTLYVPLTLASLFLLRRGRSRSR